MTSQQALATAKGIAMACKFKQLTYDEAKAKAQPYLDIVNAKGKELSKKYNKRWTNINFTAIIR